MIKNKILNALLDIYESSKTYTGENKVNQVFSIKPSKIFKDYESDNANVDDIERFEYEVNKLACENLIDIQKNNRGIQKIIAKHEKIADYYTILNRTEKRVLRETKLKEYKSYLGINKILDKICYDFIKNLTDSQCKNDKTVKILELCKFILTNKHDLLERELSILVLGDSKLWENKYRQVVCSTISKYVDFSTLLDGLNINDDTDKREIQKIILAEYQIYSNPSYIYFKGNAEFIFSNGDIININLPVAFSTETLKNIAHIKIKSDNIITVENLTSFNRIQMNNTFFIFLSGYHNHAKQQFIKQIASSNSGLNWYHFGDIDPDGFYIIEHLKQGIGIKFKPLYMDIVTLQKYRPYTKSLTSNDITKAKNMLSNNLYTDVLSYMLDNNIKLEQEIISLKTSITKYTK